MRGLGDEAEGIQYEPVISPLEDAGRWVQWAETSSTASTLDWSGNSDNTRYNLSQFWTLKRDHYDEDPEAWDRLDLRAMKAWAALAEMGMVKDNPPANPKYQQEAQQAYAGAIAAAQRLGVSTSSLEHNQTNSAAWYQQAQGKGIDDTMKAAVTDRVNELLADVNGLLGLPMWAWVVGGVGLLWLLYGRKA
jgi:hypothetical protein